jgi:hypothetical protein
MTNDNIVGKVIMAVFVLALIGLVFVFKGDITGYVVYENVNHSIDLDITTDSDMEYNLSLGSGELRSFKINGNYSLGSRAKVYLYYFNEDYLIFDSFVDEGLREYSKINLSSISVNSSDTSVEHMNITLGYYSRGSPQPVGSFVDFFIDSYFSWDADYSKVCTKWKVNDDYICNGGSDCCLFLDREPYSEEWNSSFGISYSDIFDNNVTASVHYIDYNLSSENPYVSIISSSDAALDADFYESYSFELACSQTCGLSNIYDGPYKLVFEISNGSITVSNASYSLISSSVMGEILSSNTNSTLGVFDQGDEGFDTILRNNIKFYASYNSSSDTTIGNASCNITFSDGGFGSMDYISKTFPYIYIRSFNSTGFYSYNVSCNSSYGILNETGNVTVNLPDVHFIDSDNYFTAVKESSLAFADYDNDGWWDLVISGTTDTGSTKLTTFYKNNGDGTYSADSSYSVDNFYKGSMSFGDINRDGKLDMVIMGNNGTQMSKVYTNNGSSMNLFQTLPGIDQGSNVLGDIDNDGDLDYGQIGTRINSESGYNHSIYKNIGENFIYSLDYEGLVFSSMNFAEFTGDDKLDMITSGTDTTALWATLIYNNNGNFNNIQNLTGVQMSSIAIFDFDNDGDLDIFIMGSTSSSRTTSLSSLYINNGTDFNLFQNFDDPVRDGSLTAGDINNDGLTDLLVTGQNKSNSKLIEFYINNGTSFVYNGTKELTGLYKSSIALFDYDDDGDLDLVVSGADSSNLPVTALYNNNVSLIINNTKPTAPLSFNDSFNDGWLNLTWGNGSDDLTPTLGLYYNLRVGTVPEGNDVVSGKYGGSSNPTQGYIGNMQQRKNIALNLTTDKTYFWQVQTIDNGLKSSDWSTIQEYNPIDCSVPNSGDWLVNASCTKANKIIYLNGNLNITDSLTLINTTLIINNSDNSYGIYAYGMFNVSNSTIKSDNDYNFSFYIDESCDLNIDYSYINDTDSVLINRSNLVLTKNTIQNNDYGIKLYGSNITIIDSIINNNIIDIYNFGDNNNLTNVTFSTKEVDSGSLYVKYYVDTYVKGEYNELISSVNVTGYNNNSQIIDSKLTNSNGYARLILVSYVSNISDISYNNYTISYSKNLLVPSNISRNISSNLEVNVSLDTSEIPITDGFDSELTTDFSSVTNLEDASGITIGKNNLGVIRFLENVNVVGLNLSNLIQIAYNYISLDSSSTGINKSANITLYNLSYTYEPVILKDDSLCSDCNVLNYSSNDLTFNVTGFSVYNATSNSQLLFSISNGYNNKPLVNETIFFSANYSNRTSSGSINGEDIYCSIVFDGISLVNMTLNTSNFVYEYNATFTSDGNINYNVSCDGTELGYEALNISSSFYVYVNKTYLVLNQSLEGVERSSIILGDLNNNDYNDIIFSGIVANGSPSTYLYNNANFFILNSSENITNVERGSMGLVDYDKDGDLDLVVLGRSSDSAEVAKFYKND